MTGMNSRSRAALPLAIFGGFALIAIAIVFVFRWETVPSSRGVAAFRLDRWTGKITFCRYSATFEMDLPSQEEMQKRIAENEKHGWFVFELNGEILGYAYGSKHRERAAYQWCWPYWKRTAASGLVATMSI